MNKQYFSFVLYGCLLLGGISNSLPVSASTFSVDSLLKVGNDNGHGTFTVTNTQKETVYVKGEVLQVKVSSGEIEKIPLTRENFPIWDLAVNPSKLRLLPGEIRDVAVKYLCKADCDRSRDLVYQIRFSPVSAPDEVEGQSVSFSFGMAPYYIVPASQQRMEYSWDYDEKAHTVKVHNTGNTYLKIQFDNCNKLRAINSCRAVYHVLSGRKMRIELPEGIQGRNVQVTVANHDQRYQDEFTL